MPAVYLNFKNNKRLSKVKQPDGHTSGPYFVWRNIRDSCLKILWFHQSHRITCEEVTQIQYAEISNICIQMFFKCA